MESNQNPSWNIDENAILAANQRNPRIQEYIDWLETNFREHYWNYVQDVKDKNDQATLAAYFAIRAMKCKLGFEEVDPDLIGFNKYAIIHNNTPMVDVATYNDEENQWEHIKTVPIV